MMKATAWMVCAVKLNTDKIITAQPSTVVAQVFAHYAFKELETCK